MTPRVYVICRAVGRPMEFKGLKAQYIVLAALALIVDLLLFVILYICRVPPIVCIVIAFSLGGMAVSLAMRFSRRFGAHGLMKYLAARRIPKAIKCPTRKTFYHLKNSNNDHPAS